MKKQNAADLTAALCATMTFIEAQGLRSAFLSNTDWTEVGLPKKSFMAIWEAHKQEDMKRRALEKLTPEEREALGL